MFERLSMPALHELKFHFCGDSFMLWILSFVLVLCLVLNVACVSGLIIYVWKTFIQALYEKKLVYSILLDDSFMLWMLTLL